MKLLLWLAIGSAVIWLWRSKKPHVEAGATSGKSVAEPMVRCMHCEVYFPASEAVVNSSGNVFCCEEHRSRHSPA